MARGRGLFASNLRRVGLGGEGLVLEPDVFLPGAFVEADVGVAGDVLEVEAQEAAFAGGAAVAHDFLVLGDAGGFEVGLHVGEGFELVGVVLLREARPVEAHRASTPGGVTSAVGILFSPLGVANARGAAIVAQKAVRSRLFIEDAFKRMVCCNDMRIGAEEQTSGGGGFLQSNSAGSTALEGVFPPESIARKDTHFGSCARASAAFVSRE
jgi:hypothetical protein